MHLHTGHISEGIVSHSLFHRLNALTYWSKDIVSHLKELAKMHSLSRHISETIEMLHIHLLPGYIFNKYCQLSSLAESKLI